MIGYIRLVRVVLAVLVIAAIASPWSIADTKKEISKSSGAVHKGSVLAVQSVIRSLSAQIDGLRAELAASQEMLETTKERVRVGLTQSSDLLPLESNNAQLQSKLSETEAALVDARRLAALASPVDVTLKSASIRQVAEVLSRVSSIKIMIDSNVGNDLRVSAQAQGVPLGAVLEVVANAVHLIIAPDGGDGGLILRKPGKLTIGGKSVDYGGSNWPWSDDWMTVPSSSPFCPVGRRWLCLFESADYQLPALKEPSAAKQK